MNNLYLKFILLLFLFCCLSKSSVYAQQFPEISINIDKSEILKNGGEATVTITLSKRSAKGKLASFSLSYETNGTGSMNYDYKIDPVMYYFQFTKKQKSISFKVKGIYQRWGSSDVDLRISIYGLNNCNINGLRYIDVNISNVLNNEYCTSYGYNYPMGITNVQFNTISKSSSANPPYTDNLSTSTDVAIGSRYDLSVRVNTASNYRVRVRAWIDWNQNNRFEDSEQFDLGVVRNKTDGLTTNSPLGIQIPIGAKIGNTRMRVSAKYNDYASPCDTDFYGEVEDYTLNVLPKLPLVSLETDKSSINEDGGAVKVRASLNETHTQDIIVNLNFSGSASSANYSCVNQIVIPAGSTFRDITLTAIDNTVSDGNRDVNIEINSIVNANENGVQQKKITIVDDDIPPNLSIADISVNEGDGAAVFRATLSSVSLNNISFRWSTADWTARQPGDYSRKTWTNATIPAGELYVDLPVTIIDDASHETDEKFTCYFRDVNNAILLNNSAICTIIDNENSSSIEVDQKLPEKDFIPEKLVTDVLVTGCLEASDIRFTGDVNFGVGFFESGDSEFPLSSGLILSNGRVKNAEGPNNGGAKSDDNSGYDFDRNNRDSDLMTLAGTVWNRWDRRWEKTYHDVQILEFDFVPAGDKLEFRYIFASEEYPDYACSKYNDGFAFIISGEGITNDPGLSGKNIALIPNSTDWVTINNVNGSSGDGSGTVCGSSANYVDESNGYSTSFNGRTEVLTAIANVEPCKTYNIKLIVYDNSDKQINSAVFLEANSFKSNEIQVDNMIGAITDSQDVMFEGCDGSYMRFIRNQSYDINKKISFKMNIAGTANNEVGQPQDYVYTNASGDLINGGVFPTTIVIPSGESYVDYHYKAVDDGVIEGDETIIFRIDKCPCSGSEYYEKTVTIIDAPQIDAVASAAIQCVGGANPVATITVKLTDGIDSNNYLYSFDGGTTFDTDNVKTIASSLPDGSDLVGKTISIVVKDLFSCSNNTLTRTTKIPSISPVLANAGGPRKMCEGSGVQIMGEPAPYCEWTCSTPDIINYLSDVNVSNPRIADDIPVGVYEFTLRVQDKAGFNPTCFEEDKMILTVLESPVIESVVADDYELCSEENVMLHATVTNLPVTYSWNPSDGLSDARISNPVFSAKVLSEESRSFTLTVESGNKCTAVANLVQAISVYPLPTVMLDVPSSNLCSDGTDGEIKLSASGGTPRLVAPLYDYSWSHDASLNSSEALGLNAGRYTITVNDSKACSTVKSYDISQKPKPIGIFFE